MGYVGKHRQPRGLTIDQRPTIKCRTCGHFPGFKLDAEHNLLCPKCGNNPELIYNMIEMDSELALRAMESGHIPAVDPSRIGKMLWEYSDGSSVFVAPGEGEPSDGRFILPSDTSYAQLCLEWDALWDRTFQHGKTYEPAQTT